MKLKHNNKGFSLVELIVVIAIMAILGGVGTAGYTKYIEQTNKKADMALVGNIMRAIETGTNSTMFVSDDSFKLGEISYPIGFVSLSKDGSSIVTSSTAMNTVDKRECHFISVRLSELVSTDTSFDCPNGKGIYAGTYDETKTCYSLNTVTVRLCETHSQIKDYTESVLDSEHPSSYTHTGTSKGGLGSYKCVDHTLIPVPLNIPAETKVGIAVYRESSSIGLCEYAYANQNSTFTNDIKINGLKPQYDADGTIKVEGTSMDTSTELYGAVEAAFGDPSTLKLKYDGWSKEEGIDYATFYTTAPSLMTEMKKQSGLLALASQSDVAQSLLGLNAEYENDQAVLAGISGSVASTHTEASWMEAWNIAADKKYDEWGFGLSGRENYSAARMAYNNAFASYLQANKIDETYVNIVKNYYTQEIYVPLVGNVGLPGVVNTNAFTNSESKLKQKFNNDSVFEQCANLYEKYKTSSACEENGRLVYNTLITFDQTKEIASDKNNAYGGNMFDYYNSYVNEISALYDAAQAATGDGIVIIVSVENGVVKCDVSPKAANPRSN